MGHPCLYLGGLVDGVVVHHQVQLPFRVGPGYLPEKDQELLASMPKLARGGD